MTYDQWFKSQQGIPYEGQYLFAEAAWEHQLRRVVELAAERDRLRAALEEAVDGMGGSYAIWSIKAIEALKGQP